MPSFLFYLTFFLVGAITSFSWAGEPLTVRFLDVGYADAIVLQLPGERNAMIDTGDSLSVGKVIESLNHLGISRLDFVVITHPHENHVGGLKKILAHFDIGHVYVNVEEAEGDNEYSALVSDIKNNRIPVTTLQRHDKINWENADTKILVLHPSILSGSLNEDSLSLLLDHGATRFWFTADIPPQAQDKIIREFPEVLTADCVQVPHHGGMLSEDFLSMEGDKIFIMSTGKNNYGKPLMEYVNALSGQLLRTDREGDVTLISDGVSIKVLHE